MGVRRRSLVLLPVLLSAGLWLPAAPASAVTITWVPIGDPGNAPDTASNCYEAPCGAVAYPYLISKYEVTNAQYAEFLNVKAAVDPLGLYNTTMGSDAQGGITRSGSPGSYTYASKPGFANRPVNFVSFSDALRFANWLNNGQGTGDTETGAYTLLGGTATPSNVLTVTRNPGAITFLPTESEWYKAAYYDGLEATYFDYPAGSNTVTTCSGATATPNRANCANQEGGVTSVGAYTGSPSPYGTFDQGGNVREWNEEIPTPSNRGARGGSWNSNIVPLAAASPASSGPTNEFASIGFRLASCPAGGCIPVVPEPGTTVLFMAGLAGLAWKLRR